jgi:hypothetical protein
MFEPTRFRNTEPVAVLVANPDLSKKPAVLESTAFVADKVTEADVYPVFSMPPESPSWINIEDVPDRLTPLNITVTRFTQLGIPVKSMLVPDVLA